MTNNANPLRPWGVQTGHQTESAKLLLILDRHVPADWRLRAPGSCSTGPGRAVGTRLMEGWSTATTWKGTCGPNEQFWVQAESLAAAALRGARAGPEIIG